MRTKNFFQNSVKVSAIFLFAVAMVSVFSACEKDDDDDKDDPVPAPEETRSLESYHYDDLAVISVRWQRPTLRAVWPTVTLARL